MSTGLVAYKTHLYKYQLDLMCSIYSYKHIRLASKCKETQEALDPKKSNKD